MQTTERDLFSKYLLPTRRGATDKNRPRILELSEMGCMASIPMLG